MATRLCQILHTSQDFSTVQVKITKTKYTVNIGHDCAAFLILDCVDEKGAAPPPRYCIIVQCKYGCTMCVCLSFSGTFKYPWARGLCYRGGLDLNAEQQMQEVVRYPSEIPNQYCGPTYPSLVLPFQRLNLDIGGCSVTPLKTLQVLSVPADFPLSLALAHSLCTHTLALFGVNPSSLATLRSTQALSQTLEGLARLLCRLDLPRVLKERTLHLFSQVLWTLCAVAPTTPSPLPPSLLQGLKQEVLALYELEVGRFSKAKNKTSFPPAGSISDGGQGKFSTYFQSLLECVLAAGSYSSKFHGTHQDTPSITSSPSSSQTESTSLAGRKRAQRGVRGRRPFRSAVARGNLAESNQKKREEWLGVVTTASLVLTSIASSIDSSTHPTARLPPQHCETALAGSLPVHPNSRLVVVTGIPCNLPVDETRDKLRKVCRSFGGLHGNRLYLPTRDVVRERERTQTQPAGQDTDASTATDPSPSSQELVGHAVLELNCSTNSSAVCSAILNLPLLVRGGGGEGEGLAATGVSDTLTVGENKTAGLALEDYLRLSLVGEGNRSLLPLAREVLQSIFKLGKKEVVVVGEEPSVTECVCPTGDLLLFLAGYTAGEREGAEREMAGAVWGEIHRAEVGGSEGREGVTSEDFLRWCEVRAVESPRKVWLGLFACGYDCHFIRYVRTVCVCLFSIYT